VIPKRLFDRYLPRRSPPAGAALELVALSVLAFGCDLIVLFTLFV
jgi:hypothetical protein